MVAAKIQLKNITNLNGAKTPLDGISGFLYTQVLTKNQDTLQNINNGTLEPNVFINYMLKLQLKIDPSHPKALDIPKRIELSTYLVAYLTNYSQTAEKFTVPCLTLAVTNLYKMLKNCPDYTTSIITQTVDHLVKATDANTQVEFAQSFLQTLNHSPFNNSAKLADLFLDKLIENFFGKLDDQAQLNASRLITTLNDFGSSYVGSRFTAPTSETFSKSIDFVALFLGKLKEAPSKESDQLANHFLEKLYAFFQPKLIEESISVEMKQHITTLFKRIAEIFDLERSELVFTSSNSVIWPNTSPRAESALSAIPAQQQENANKRKHRKPAKVADIASPTAPGKKDEIIVSTKKSKKSRKGLLEIVESNVDEKEIKKERRIKRKPSPKNKLEVQQIPPLSNNEPAIKLEINQEPSIWVETNSTFNKIANTIDAYLRDELDDSNIIAKEEGSTHSHFCELRNLMPAEFKSKLSEIESLHNRMQEINDEIEQLAPKIGESYKLIEQQYTTIAKKEDLNITNKKTELTKLELTLNTRCEQLNSEIIELKAALSATSRLALDEGHLNILNEILEQDNNLQNENTSYFTKNFKDIPKKINHAFLTQLTNRSKQIQQLMIKQSKLAYETDLNQNKLDASVLILESKNSRLLNTIKENNAQLIEPQLAIDKAMIVTICDSYKKIVSLKETIEDELPVPLKLLDPNTLEYKQRISNNNNNFNVDNNFSANDLPHEDLNRQQYICELKKLKELSEENIAKHNVQKDSVEIKIAEYQASYHQEREKLIENINQSYKQLNKLANDAADFFSESNVSKMSTVALCELKMALSEIKLYNEEVISLREKYQPDTLNKNLSNLDNEYVESLNRDVSEFEKQKELVKKIRLLSEITALKNKLNDNIAKRNDLLSKFKSNKDNINHFTQNLTQNIDALQEQIKELSLLKSNLSDYSFKDKYLAHCDERKKAYFEKLNNDVHVTLNDLNEELNNYKKKANQVELALSSKLFINYCIVKHEEEELDYNSGFIESTLTNEEKDLSTLKKTLSSLAEKNLDTSLQDLQKHKDELNNLINTAYVELPKMNQPLEVNNDSPAILKMLTLFSQILRDARILNDIIVPYTEQETLDRINADDEKSKDILKNITNLVTQQSELSPKIHKDVDAALREIKKASLATSKETVAQIESKLNKRKADFEKLKVAYAKMVDYNDSLSQLENLKSTRDDFKQLIDEMNSDLINSIIQKGDVAAGELFTTQRESISEQLESLNREIAQFEETQTALNNALTDAFPGLSLQISDIETILSDEAKRNNDIETALQTQKSLITDAELKLVNKETEVSTTNFDVKAIEEHLAQINSDCDFISQEQISVSELADNKQLLNNIKDDAAELPQKLIYWGQQVNECQETAKVSAFDLKKGALSGWYANIVADITDLKTNLEISRKQYEKDCKALGKLPEEVNSKENNDLIKELAKDFVKTNNMIAKSTHLPEREKDNLLQEFKEISRSLQDKGVPKVRADAVYTSKLDQIIEHKEALTKIEKEISEFERDVGLGVDLSDVMDEKAINSTLKKLEAHQNKLVSYQEKMKGYNNRLNNLATIYENDANICKNEIKTDLTDTQTAFKNLQRKVAKREKEITLNRLSSVRSYSTSAALPLLGALIGAAIGPAGFIIGFALGCAIAAVRVLKRSANKTKPPLEAVVNKKTDNKPVRDHFTLFSQKLAQYELTQYELAEDAKPANNVVLPALNSNNILTVS